MTIIYSMNPIISLPQLSPDERMWRIDWLGELYYPAGSGDTQPSFKVSMSPVQCDVNDAAAMLSPTATNLNHQRQVSLKIGLLNLIKVGDIWKNGQFLIAPDYQSVQFKKLMVHKTTMQQVKAGFSIDENFILPLPEHPWHRRDTKSYCISITLPNDKRIVIPCLELIRFYFGSSSKFLHLLFTQPISGELFWNTKQFNEKLGHLHLKLADDISGMSATDIGRVALDRNAWYAAKLIFSSCMTSMESREHIYPFTYFPFFGETDLSVTGKWLPQGIKPNATFVVYNIKSCSHPFPFKSLSYEMFDSQKVAAKKENKGNESQIATGNNVTINTEEITSQTIVNKDLVIQKQLVKIQLKWHHDSLI